MSSLFGIGALILAAQSVGAVCDICSVRNPHSGNDYSTPFDGPATNYPACKNYKDAACCDAKTVQECEFCSVWSIEFACTLHQHVHV
jgi:hypothetical protein